MGRFLIFAIRYLDIGLHVGNPRAILEAVHEFNNRKRPAEPWEEVQQQQRAVRKPLGRGRLERNIFVLPDADTDLVVRVFDLKEFFPSCPREGFLHALRYTLKLVRARHKDAKYF